MEMGNQERNNRNTMYQQIVIEKSKARCEWKEYAMTNWKQESPDAEIVEETNALLILKIPAHEQFTYKKRNSFFVPETYAVYGVHELRIYPDSRIYWEPDLYYETETLEEAKEYSETISLRNTLLGQVYDLSQPIGDK